MEKEELTKKSKVIKVMVVPSEETVDFVDFVDEVLGYQMVRTDAIACLIVLERPKGE